MDVETGAGGGGGDWKVDRFKTFSILVNNREEIRALDVTVCSCNYIEVLADPAGNGLKVTIEKNFVGEPYFLFWCRECEIFGVGGFHGLWHKND